MRKVGYGVIGLGQFGEKHTQVLSSLPNVDLIAVCSHRKERAKEIAEKYGAKKWHTDFNEMLKNKEIEAVSIVTAEPEHRKPTVTAAKKGKHILLEKPIAMNLENADAMIEATQKAGVFFMVGHILRFCTPYVTAKQEIDEGKIGDVLSLYARRNTPARVSDHYLRRISSIIGDGLHDIDLMLWYTDAQVKSVYASSVSARSLANPDIGWSMYTFDSGAVGICENAWFLPEKTPFSIDARMEIIGTEGVIYIDVSNGGIAVNDKSGWRYPDTIHWPVQHGKRIGCLKEEISYFVDCVMKGDEPNIIKPEEARAAIEAVIAADKSAKMGQIISLPEK